MAFSLNKVQLIGRLGRDVETRITASDNYSVSRFSLATTRSYKKDEEWINETTWHNIVAFNLSDYYRTNLLKGNLVYVEGRLSRSEYEDKAGNKHSVVDIIAENIIILGEPKEKQDKSEEAEIKEPAPKTRPIYAQDEQEDIPF